MIAHPSLHAAPQEAATRQARGALAGQIALVSAGLGALTMVPPANGPMLLLPVTGESGPVLSRAIAGGARLIGAGALRGSFVIVGSRARLWRTALATGALLLAAPPGACGARDSEVAGEAA